MGKLQRWFESISRCLIIGYCRLSKNVSRACRTWKKIVDISERMSLMLSVILSSDSLTAIWSSSLRCSIVVVLCASICRRWLETASTEDVKLDCLSLADDVRGRGYIKFDWILYSRMSCRQSISSVWTEFNWARSF
jgi:hypothetical protein